MQDENSFIPLSGAAEEKEVLHLDTWRALTELDALAKEAEEFNRKYPKK